MNAQIFGTGDNFEILTPVIIVGIVLYFTVLPTLPAVIAGWRCYGNRMGIPGALGALYGFLVAIGLAAIMTPWAYLPGMIWWLAVVPPAVAVAGPVVIVRSSEILRGRRDRTQRSD